MDVITHYDLLIQENNDPFRDPPELRAYMDQWDGDVFFQALELAPWKEVLEIGMGTGRLAAKVAPCCASLTGIDISTKTVERAQENLKEFRNISYICDDFHCVCFLKVYDVVYSSLTMMHFEDKAQVITKVSELLKADGIFCLSISKDQSPYIDMGSRKPRVYPDTPEHIISLVQSTDMSIVNISETPQAYVIVSKKASPS
jgi:2-polyprenyl-3-methyl-5-hydroxy-6-metoxy-1,4-benzoquinol methylase